MVFGLILPNLIEFVFVMIVACVGALRALEVYFDPECFVKFDDCVGINV
jgi:hypothetical protein